MKINENTNIGLPLRNLIGLIAAIVIGAWFAFGVIERLNKLETADILFKENIGEYFIFPDGTIKTVIEDTEGKLIEDTLLGTGG